MQLNLELFFTLLLLLFQVGLGTYVLLRTWRSRAGVSFAGFCFSVFLWTVAAFMLKNAKSSTEVMVWGRYIFGPAVLIAYLFIYFSFVFPTGE